MQRLLQRRRYVGGLWGELAKLELEQLELESIGLLLAYVGSSLIWPYGLLTVAYAIPLCSFPVRLKGSVDMKIITQTVLAQ